MLFASLKAGRYAIIENDIVIANIHRDFSYCRGKYPTYEYVVSWKDAERPIERFATLSDIAVAHRFDNYSGYNNVLSKRK